MMKITRPIGPVAAARTWLAIPLVALALLLVPNIARANYTFAISGSNATATGDTGTGPLYIVESGGYLYHSTDGVNFSNDWSGTGAGTTLAASSSSTVTVTVSSGDGSSVHLGYNVLTPASSNQAHIILEAPSNTSDTVLIDDSIASGSTTYTIDTSAGSITTTTGINCDTSSSANPFGGGITLDGALGGDTFNLTATKTGEPLTLVGTASNDTFNVPNPSSAFNSTTTFNGGGGGTDTLSFAGSTTGLTALHMSGGSVTGITNLSTSSIEKLVGGSGSDTMTVVPGSSGQTVDGGNPTPPAVPGDRLTVDTSATTTPSVTSTLSASGYSGSFTFGNANSVSFSDIESISPALDTSTLSKTCTVGAACSVPFVLTGTGTAPFSLTAGASSLPPGVTLDTTTGALTGTPTTAGTYSSALTVQDSRSATVSGTASITVQKGLSVPALNGWMLLLLAALLSLLGVLWLSPLAGDHRHQ